LVERVAGKYAYRLTGKGQQVALLFLLFHKWLSGPLAGSQFHRRPDEAHRPKVSKLEAAYYRADKAIDNVIATLRAAYGCVNLIWPTLMLSFGPPRLIDFRPRSQRSPAAPEGRRVLGVA